MEKCDKCERTFETKQGLTLHHRWNHSAKGRKIMLAAARGNARVARAASAKNRGGKKAIRDVMGSLTDEVFSDIKTARRAHEEKPKRRQYRRKFVDHLSDDPKFCPKCGCNMGAVKLAMNYKG